MKSLSTSKAKVQAKRWYNILIVPPIYGTRLTGATISKIRVFASIASWFAAMLSFLGAAAEARRYREWIAASNLDSDSNGETLFEKAIVDWASANSDEIAMLHCEIEDSKEELISAI